MAFSGLSPSARLRLPKLLLAGIRHRGLDLYDLNRGPEPEADSAWDWCVRHLGEEAATWFVDPLVRNFHVHSARELSSHFLMALAALAIQPRALTSYVLSGVMASLPQALSKGLNLELGRAVARVEQRGVRPQVDHRSFDRVVLALPAPQAARLLCNPSPEQAALLGAVRFSSSMSVQFTVAVADLPAGLSVWVPFAESPLLAAITEGHPSSTRQGRRVMQALLHDEGARAMMGDPDEAVFAAVEQEWARLHPALAGKLRRLFIQRWPCALPVYDTAAIRAIRRFWPHQGQGGIAFAGDWLNHPWTEGAARCGRRVARLIA
jgi:protoporphyrinogen oxidase